MKKHENDTGLPLFQLGEEVCRERADKNTFLMYKVTSNYKFWNLIQKNRNQDQKYDLLS